MEWCMAWKKALNALDKKGYKVGALFNKNYKSHRIIWFMIYGCWPEHVDHINGIKSDNRISNLRNVSNLENHRNMGLQKNNKTGVSGVDYCKEEKVYRARIRNEGREIILGYYQNLKDAKNARKLAEIKYKYHKNHGDRIRNDIKI